MRFEITLRVTTPDGETEESEIIALDKRHDRHEDTGLSIEEGKALLKSLQHQIVEAQAEAFCASKSVCQGCRRRLRKKGAHAIRYRTVFGDIPVNSPRYYHCRCKGRRPKTFSPLTELLPNHTAPELLWLETRWASLVSFGVSTRLLKDVLPIGESLNAETVRNHLHKAARRMEDELAEEQVFFIETCPRDRAAMPIPEGPITVGIDGGYVRSQEKKQPHFEVMVAKSMPADRPNRYLGLVHTHDTKPKRRLHEVLKEQGWQDNQPVTFLTDGGDTVRNMALYMAPASEHLLDWFHITMRITVMRQYVKGLTHHNPEEGQATDRLLRQIKGYLWNGNLRDGHRVIRELVMSLECIETNYPSIKALYKAADEFEVYICNNAWMIPNYAERHRYGERVSTGFVESAINTVVGKRFGKRQQMRWSRLGAHLMLQTRTRALDGTLRKKFEQWYPGLKNDGAVGEAEQLAA